MLRFTVVLGICCITVDLWAGKLKNWAKTKAKLKTEGKAVELVDKYTDGAGKRRWKGNKALRGSESGT